MRTTPTSATVRRLAAQGHLIGGRWRRSASGGVHEHRYAATGEVQAEVGLAGADDVDAAVAAARRAQPAWGALGPDGRGRVLHALADLLDEHRDEAADLAALDNGTPVSVLRPGRATAAWVRFYADLAATVGDERLEGVKGTATVRRQPYGVVGAIPPWNGSMIGMGQKCGPALAAGNAVVAKPPELSRSARSGSPSWRWRRGFPAACSTWSSGEGRRVTRSPAMPGSTSSPSPVGRPRPDG